MMQPNGLFARFPHGTPPPIDRVYVFCPLCGHEFAIPGEELEGGGLWSGWCPECGEQPVLDAEELLGRLQFNRDWFADTLDYGPVLD